MNFGKELKVHKTTIPGVLVIDMPVHGDNRGWFKENWQREKKTTAGLPDFGPVQNNISYYTSRGTTRGIHAEPWDKFISLGNGSVFTAVVDLREGETFGRVETFELDPSKGLYLPRGCGNSFQTLEDNTVYTYLVNDHWYPNAEYSFVNLADPTLNIAWPIPLDEAEISEKDRNHPYYNDVVPMKRRRVLITGANGQLGRALARLLPDAEAVDRESFDITDPTIMTARNWRQYETIINTASYTKVDDSETPAGRKEAWEVNAKGVRNLARIASEFNITLVQLSSDYVFDGEGGPYSEEEPMSPLNTYGQSKTAGDVAAETAPRHYIIRSAWAVGEGHNFVATMLHIAKNDGHPKVVDDQVGRLSFSEEIAAAIVHLLKTNAAYGTYNVTGDGEPASWAQIAKLVFELSGHDPKNITPVTSQEYFKSREYTVAERPKNSVLALDKLKSTGFNPADWRISLKRYLKENK